jgi:hypothetical protein
MKKGPILLGIGPELAHIENAIPVKPAIEAALH